MQLKRDTDFALRILFCLKQNHDKKDAEGPEGLTLTEIAKQTGVPKLAAGRICDCLQARGMIRLSGDREYTEKEYSSSAGGLIVWPAKLMVPLGFAILLIQGISELIKRVAIMQGKIPDPHEGARGHGVEG